jgi:hypothetical protein
MLERVTRQVWQVRQVHHRHAATAAGFSCGAGFVYAWQAVSQVYDMRGGSSSCCSVVFFSKGKTSSPNGHSLLGLFIFSVRFVIVIEKNHTKAPQRPPQKHHALAISSVNECVTTMPAVSRTLHHTIYHHHHHHHTIRHHPPTSII